jgi:hypothetical protein
VAQPTTLPHTPYNNKHKQEYLFCLSVSRKPEKMVEKSAETLQQDVILLPTKNFVFPDLSYDMKRRNAYY